MIRRSFLFPVVAVACILSLALPLRGDYPKPSPFPISWELTMTHSRPTRFVYQTEGDANPIAYWYMTYHVANNTDRDKIMFYPVFEMLTQDGQTIRSDQSIPPGVFTAIKEREHLKYLQDANHIGGELRQGEDQSKDGVAIWIEPSLRMGTFEIFISGFWGETATTKVGDKTVILHKTLDLTYHVNGDDNTLSDTEQSQYVMR